MRTGARVKRLRRWLARIGRMFRRAPVPDRYLEYAQSFGRARPTADRREWIRFACRLAAVAYADGRALGLEEGAARARMPVVARRHGWSLAQVNPRLAEELRRADPDDPIPAFVGELARAEAFDRVGRRDGTFRVVYLPEKVARDGRGGGPPGRS